MSSVCAATYTHAHDVYVACLPSAVCLAYALGDELHVHTAADTSLLWLLYASTEHARYIVV